MNPNDKLSHEILDRLAAIREEQVKTRAELTHVQKAVDILAEVQIANAVRDQRLQTLEREQKAIGARQDNTEKKVEKHDNLWAKVVGAAALVSVAGPAIASKLGWL